MRIDEFDVEINKEKYEKRRIRRRKRNQRLKKIFLFWRKNK